MKKKYQGKRNVKSEEVICVQCPVPSVNCYKQSAANKICLKNMWRIQKKLVFFVKKKRERENS